MFLGCVEGWGQLRILRRKIISERCERRDESIASICQRKNAELVKGVCCIGGGGKQPVGVILIDTLREEGDNSEKPSCVVAEFLERGGGE